MHSRYTSIGSAGTQTAGSIAAGTGQYGAEGMALTHEREDVPQDYRRSTLQIEK